MFVDFNLKNIPASGKQEQENMVQSLQALKKHCGVEFKILARSFWKE